MSPEVKPNLVAFLEVEIDLNLAEKCTLQQTCVSYPITRAHENIPVKTDWACDARGASRQEIVLFVYYECPLD